MPVRRDKLTACEAVCDDHFDSFRRYRAGGRGSRVPPRCPAVVRGALLRCHERRSRRPTCGSTPASVRCAGVRADRNRAWKGGVEPVHRAHESADPDKVMPPKGGPLKADEINRLRQSMTKVRSRRDRQRRARALRTTGLQKARAPTSSGWCTCSEPPARRDKADLAVNPIDASGRCAASG